MATPKGVLGTRRKPRGGAAPRRRVAVAERGRYPSAPVALRLFCCFALLLGAVACAEAPAQPEGAAAAATASAAVAEPDRPGAASRECEQATTRAEREPALPGAPAFEAHRGEILGRAKATPVLFRRAPERARDASSEVRALWARLDASPSPGFTFLGVFKTVMRRPEAARALLLSDGYLYSDVPDLAAAFVDVVELHHLFDDPELTIQRGSQIIHAKKGKSFWYDYSDGPERGQRARLLLLDRVWPTGTDPGPPLAIDLSTAAKQVAGERMRIERISPAHVIAKVRHGTDWVRALFRVDGAESKLECETVPEALVSRVAAARALAQRRRNVFERMRVAMTEMVGEALPFDEPRTEEGQQDGNLRPAWRWAYTHGWDSYTFNDDTYLVFDSSGRPKIPQVCIDFITDTIERASGTWWATRDQERARISGGVDFDAVGIENRRSVDVFIRFADQHPEWFDVYTLRDDERVRFFDRAEFFTQLDRNSDRYSPGDIVAIHGPRSDGENHWHSFYVYEADPLTGMPMLLASNAGHPRIRTWEGEMRAAPRRSIHTRIRPRLDWLERVIGHEESVVLGAPARPISAPI
jgi:hypothetical protein